MLPSSFADDDDNDEIDDNLEALNSRTIEIEVQSNGITIKSTLEGGERPDEFELKISTEENQLQFDMEYNHDIESGEIELNFYLIFYSVIEYVDLDSDGLFNASNDQLIQEYKIENFRPVEYSKITNENNTQIHVINVTTTDGVFSTQIYAVEEFELINTNLISPTEMKIDIAIHNFNYLNGSSSLALLMKLSDDEYEGEEETEDETEGFADNEMEVETTLGDYSGFFSWAKYALIDGSSQEVKANLNEANSELLINYPRGSDIHHDPKIGIEGILRFSPSINILSTILIIILIGILSFSIVISKQEYREYLLTRVLHINPEPHRLNMEEVLENENRSQIINIILEEPGVHFNELLRKMGISAGNLAWHLDILESYKVIQKRRIGQYLLFYSYLEKNPFQNLDPKLMKSKTTLDILQLISDNPGMYQNQIAKRLDLNHKTVKYHLEKLLEADLIFSEKGLRRLRFYPKIETLVEEF